MSMGVGTARRGLRSLGWLLLLGLLGCSDRTPSTNAGTASEPVHVAVSIPPQAYLVERIGGRDVQVVTVLRPGENPHAYLPSDAEISAVLQTKVYFRIGVPFEKAKWFETISRSGRVRIADMREGIALRSMEAHRDPEDASSKSEHEPGVCEEHAGPDPHIWLAPALLKIQAACVERVLSDVLPAKAGEFRKNLAELEQELDALDGQLRTRLAGLKGTDVYVYHPSWGYFCDAYGLHQCAIEVEGKEPSDAELTALQAKARNGRVRVVFVQPQIAGRAARAVAHVMGAEVRVLDPLARDVLANLRAVGEAMAGGAP